MTEEIKPVYTIKEDAPAEDGVIVQRHGVPLEFPLANLSANCRHYEKELREAEAQKKIELAMMENVKMNNPGLIERVTEEEMAAIYVYYENLVASRASQNKADSAKELIAEHEKMKAEIKAQTGVDADAPEPEPAAEAVVEEGAPEETAAAEEPAFEEPIPETKTE